MSTEAPGSAPVQAVSAGEGEAVSLEDEIKVLREENTSLRANLRKMNRQFTMQQNNMLYFEKLSATRDRLAAVLKAEQGKQEKFMNMMLENSSNIIILLDSEGRFAYCTNTFLKFAGIQNFGLVDGRHFSEVFEKFNVGSFSRHAEKQISRAVEGKETVESQEKFDVRGDGDVRIYNTNTTAMRDAAGNVEGIMLLFHDITEAYYAREAAEASNRAKSEFLASMSHEIRTPLNAVNGLAELELRKDHPPETLTNLEKIYGSGVTLLNIINDILDISKIESGRFELVPIDYDIPSIISDTVSMNIVRIGSKQIKFSLELDENLPCRLYGDELRVKQILNNLLSNAIKYTPEGIVELKVVCEREGDECLLLCSIRDSGIGISKENLTKLFSEYQQVDMQSHRTIEGTGLGLSICKNLVQMMGGDITVESEYGHGSTFTVRLKQKIIDARPIGPEVAANLKTFQFLEGQSRRVKNVDFVPMPYGKVLVVDDVQTNLDVAKGMMAVYNLTVHCVNSGRKAIDIIRAKEVIYDVVFMDHMMPEMDGIETVRIIREELDGDYAKTVPIVALTANAIVGNDKMFLESGFQAFLSKPIDVVKLDAVLHEWVRDKQSAQTLQRAEAVSEAPKQDNGEAVLAEMMEKISIRGVDLNAGKRRFNNNAEVYLRIVNSFAQNMPKALDTLRVVTRETLDQYAIQIHGAKGSCYGISADEAGAIAQELEIAAKAGDYDKVARGNGEFIRAVEELIEEFAPLLENAAELRSMSGKAKLPAPDEALLSQLLAACEDYDADEMGRIVDELDKNAYESGGELIPWLRDRITNFEYDQIQERLAK